MYTSASGASMDGVLMALEIMFLEARSCGRVALTICAGGKVPRATVQAGGRHDPLHVASVPRAIAHRA